MNKELQHTLEIAINTEKTAKLSKDVLKMVKNGRNSLESLMNLQMPDLKPFQNEHIRNEFYNITEKLNLW